MGSNKSKISITSEQNIFDKNPHGEFVDNWMLYTQ